MSGAYRQREWVVILLIEKVWLGSESCLHFRSYFVVNINLGKIVSHADPANAHTSLHIVMGDHVDVCILAN